MIWMKSGLSEAPPTRNPSMSAFFANSRQFPALTDPAQQNVNKRLFIVVLVYQCHECNWNIITCSYCQKDSIIDNISNIVHRYSSEQSSQYVIMEDMNPTHVQASHMVSLINTFWPSTSPPYRMRTDAATSGETFSDSHWRRLACTSCAWSGVAVLPVPIAHTGSYAITTFSHRSPTWSTTRQTVEQRLKIVTHSMNVRRLKCNSWDDVRMCINCYMHRLFLNMHA